MPFITGRKLRSIHYSQPDIAERIREFDKCILRYTRREVSYKANRTDILPERFRSEAIKPRLLT